MGRLAGIALIFALGFICAGVYMRYKERKAKEETYKSIVKPEVTEATETEEEEK